MTQTERAIYLIDALLKEQHKYSQIKIPTSDKEQRSLLRALFNLRMPKPVSKEFLEVQNAYLKERTRQKGITNYKKLQPIQPGLYLFKGDITTLQCDAIVNAANRQLLGCFYPNHGCIDNAIHTFAGVQLRLACAELMKRQSHEEKTGNAKITPAFNLPCRYVLHTVGPIINGDLTKRDCKLMSSCYKSCLKLAEQNGIKSIAFCCISTGEFHFPNNRAAEIAVHTVKEYKKQTHSKIEVIFNVYKQLDYDIYKQLLKTD